MAKVFAMGYWLSQVCDSSLGGLPTGLDNSWGLLTWKQQMDDDNFSKIDILDSSNTALVLDIDGESSDNVNYNIDLSQFSEIGENQDIKIRFRIYRITGNCRIYDIFLNKKVKGMTTTNLLGEEIRDWLASQEASGDTSTVNAPNRFLFGSGNTTPTANDTSLVTELTDEAFSSTPTKSNLQVTYFGELDTGEQNGETLKEGGIADNTTDKTLYGRFVHTDISKDASKTVSYEFTIALEVN